MHCSVQHHRKTCYTKAERDSTLLAAVKPGGILCVYWDAGLDPGKSLLWLASRGLDTGLLRGLLGLSELTLIAPPACSYVAHSCKANCCLCGNDTTHHTVQSGVAAGLPRTSFLPGLGQDMKRFTDVERVLIEEPTFQETFSNLRCCAWRDVSCLHQLTFQTFARWQTPRKADLTFCDWKSAKNSFHTPDCRTDAVLVTPPVQRHTLM